MEGIHPLRAWRDEHRLKLKPAAETLGVSVPTLSRYETGTRVPSLAQAVKLSEKTGIPVDKFVKCETQC